MTPTLDGQHPFAEALDMADEEDDPYARAVTGLVQALQVGGLRPGDPVPVPPYAERFGLSTTPVREALAHLNGAGLLSRHHRHGYAVPDLTASDLIDLFELEAAVLSQTSADNPLASVLLARIDIRLVPLRALLEARDEVALLARAAVRPLDPQEASGRRDRLLGQAERFARSLREGDLRFGI